MSTEQPIQQPEQEESACPTAIEPMAKWIAVDDEKKCRPCILPVTVSWYLDELKERKLDTLLGELDDTRKTGDNLKTAQALDDIKGKVEPDIRKRLLEFDCATQTFDPEEPEEEITAK